MSGDSQMTTGFFTLQSWMLDSRSTKNEIRSSQQIQTSNDKKQARTSRPYDFGAGEGEGGGEAVQGCRLNEVYQGRDKQLRCN